MQVVMKSKLMPPSDGLLHPLVVPHAYHSVAYFEVRKGFVAAYVRL